MSNHLGNLLTVINDIKVPVSADGINVDSYLATIVSTADYSPFGVQLDESTVSSESYRYGFNGQEKDDEMKGAGNSYDFGARMYDPRVARWLSRDGYESKYSNLSPYHFSNNNPLFFIDIDVNEFVNPYEFAILRKQKMEKPDAEKIARLQTLSNEVVKIVSSLKEADPELYNYINNLEFNDRKVMVYIFLADELTQEQGKEEGLYANTNFSFIPDSDIIFGSKPDQGIDGATDGVSAITIQNVFNVLIINRDAETTVTLANELGDVMYAVNYPCDTREQAMNPSTPYLRKESTHYSFNVEKITEMKINGTYPSTNDPYPLINVFGDQEDQTQDGLMIDHRNDESPITNQQETPVKD